MTTFGAKIDKSDNKTRVREKKVGFICRIIPDSLVTWAFRPLLTFKTPESHRISRVITQSSALARVVAGHSVQI